MIDPKFLTDHSTAEMPLSETIPTNEIIVFGVNGIPYKIDSSDLKKAIPNAVMLFEENDGDIPLAGNIQFLNVTDNETGMLVVVGDEGFLSLRRSTDTFIDWTDTDPNSYDVTTTPAERLSVAVTEDIPASVGSWAITCKVDNAENQFHYLTLTLKINGTEAATSTVEIQKEAVQQSVSFSGGFENDVPNGATFSVEFSGDESGSLTLRGDTTPTAIKIQKTIPAAARVYESSSSLPQNLTRADIEAVVPVEGRRGKFLLTDGSKYFRVFVVGGEYVYKKLRTAN